MARPLFDPRTVRHAASLATSLIVVAVVGGDAAAQDAPPPGEEGEAPGGPGVTVVQVPAAQPAPPQVIVPGYPQPGYNPDAHLPSSSRSTLDISRSADGFDLGGTSEGPISVKGAPSGSYVLEGQSVPEAHTVRRGDTLWDISGRYYQNPYNWPRVWSYNPQIQNPHWIYPGDRIRLRDRGESAGLMSEAAIGPGRRRGGVPPGTVFLRDVGWIDDPNAKPWGEISGSPEDQMILSEGDDVYIQLEQDHDVELGRELTVYQPLEAWRNDGKSGKLVSIRGTARVDRYNPKTRTIRARLIESLDTIERGAKVGPVERRFDVVPPVPNQVDVEARVIGSVYPHQMYGQHQVVFINQGARAGLRPGNRLFAVERGDRWRATLDTAGQMAKRRPRVEDVRATESDPIEDSGDEELFPDETYAELRVLRVKENTATALVTASTHEVERSARLVAKKGY